MCRRKPLRMHRNVRTLVLSRCGCRVASRHLPRRLNLVRRNGSRRVLSHLSRPLLSHRSIRVYRNASIQVISRLARQPDSNRLVCQRVLQHHSGQRSRRLRCRCETKRRIPQRTRVHRVPSSVRHNQGGRKYRNPATRGVPRTFRWCRRQRTANLPQPQNDPRARIRQLSRRPTVRIMKRRSRFWFRSWCRHRISAASRMVRDPVPHGITGPVRITANHRPTQPRTG